MRSMADCSYDDMNGVDILRDFDYASIDFDTMAQEAADDASTVSVCLDCSGELVDEALVDRIAIRDSAPGFQTLLFVCPRCREPHESLRFG